MNQEHVEICSCGHEAYHHKEDKQGIRGYCRDYLYGDFDMKCTCQQFNPLMELTDQYDIYNLTDETFISTDQDDSFNETI